MQVTGPVITPFNIIKQNALLSEMAYVFPRLAFGIGPEQSRIVDVIDDASSGTATVTFVMASTGNPQLFAEARSLCSAR